MQTLAHAFDETMEEFSISGKELAAKAGVTQAMISQFRRGKQEIQTGTLERLLNALSIEAKQYFYLKALVGSIDNKGLGMILSAISYRLIQESLSESQQIVTSNLPDKALALR